ncbi:hypothetical protein [Bacteroides congonensis]|jgi:hypothetical protein|uniref:hypothetical protein n=1 Tax=Bacteroides congonensis TaxID=1871006 RepID=UPI003A85437F
MKANSTSHAIIAKLLFLAIIAIVIQSCSNEEDIQNNIREDSKEYSEYSQNMSKALDDVLASMGIPQTRSNNAGLDPETVSYLLGLSPEELEAWYDKFNETVGEDFYNNYYDYDKIKSCFSESQIAQFKQYLEAYLNADTPNNQLLIDSYTAQLDAKTRKLYILGAVYIDSIVRPLIQSIKAPQTRGMSHCELQLAARILEDTAESVVMDIALDGMDNPIIDIYCTAGDVEAVLGAVHDYHRCRAGL